MRILEIEFALFLNKYAPLKRLIGLEFWNFSFKKTLRQKPKGVTRMLSVCLVIHLHARNSFGRLRVIVNEKS